MSNELALCRDCRIVFPTEDLITVSQYGSALCINCHRANHPWLFSVREYIKMLESEDYINHYLGQCDFCNKANIQRSVHQEMQFMECENA